MFGTLKGRLLIRRPFCLARPFFLYQLSHVHAKQAIGRTAAQLCPN